MYDFQKLEIKRKFLVLITTIFISFARNSVQYDRFLWPDTKSFLISLFIHYIAIIFLSGVFYIMVNQFSDFFLGKREKRDRLEFDESKVYFCFIAITISTLLFFAGLLPVPDPRADIRFGLY